MKPLELRAILRNEILRLLKAGFKDAAYGASLISRKYEVITGIEHALIATAIEKNNLNFLEAWE